MVLAYLGCAGKEAVKRVSVCFVSHDLCTYLMSLEVIYSKMN